MQKECDINQPPKVTKPKRDIRSFVRREGRMTPAQSRALENDGYQILISDAAVSPSTLFLQDAPLVVEIGFGMGESLIEMASNHPELNYIGIEVHRPGVGAALLQIEKRELTNIRIFCQDAAVVMEQYLPPASVDRIQIFFPDPWHKKRHNKRRLIQAPFLKSLIQALKPKATLHIVTDWQDYAEHIQSQLERIPTLQNVDVDAESKRLIADRPRSKYESRALRLNHEIFNFVYSLSD